MPSGCYTFEIFDHYSDGICCTNGKGFYYVSYDGVIVQNGDEFGASEKSNKFGDGCSPAPTAPTRKPTTAPTRKPATAPIKKPTAASKSEQQKNAATLKLQVKTDNYGGETSWKLYGLDNKVVLEEDGSVYPEGNSEYIKTYSVPSGCYTFEIFDHYSDGLCCSNGEGSYKVFYNGDLVQHGGKFGGSEKSNKFGDGCS